MYVGMLKYVVFAFTYIYIYILITQIHADVCAYPAEFCPPNAMRELRR